MSDFNRAFEFTVGNEGGYSDHKSDKGGATQFGITIGTLSRWLKRAASKEDVKNLSLEEAKEIYKAWYWDPLSLDEVEHPGVSCAIFDLGVNMGITTMAKGIQRIVCVPVDGHIGPVTLRQINKKDPKDLIQQISDWAKQRYLSIIEKNPSQKVFAKGWNNRANRLLELKDWT